MLPKKLSELIHVVPASEILITALVLDSRAAVPGCLFFAYPGTVSDGRQYIGDAIKRGAIAVVFENGDGFNLDTQQYPNTLFIPMHQLAANIGLIAARFYAEPSRSLNIIGVTGTNGKTSITHFIAQAFQQHGQCCAVMGTLGNGVLPTLTQTSHTTEHAIHLQQAFAEFQQQNVRWVAMEVSSHALQQGRLSGTQLTTAVFTQLSRDHLDYHGSMQSYAQAKALLFQQSGLQYAVINQDDEYGRQYIQRFAAALDVVSYSICDTPPLAERYVIAREIIADPAGYLIKVDSAWGQGTFICSLLGKFNISNVMATLGVLLVNGVHLQQALQYCAQLQPVSGRMQLFGDAQQPKVVVDYAHTPDALQKALAELRLHCSGKLWCIFGCGGDRDKGKRPLMAAVAEQLADAIIITDDNPRTEKSELIIQDIMAGLAHPQQVQVIADRRVAIETAVQNAQSHDMVLVAGKGHETTQTIGRQVLPFDDALQVELALAKIK